MQHVYNYLHMHILTGQTSRQSTVLGSGAAVVGPG